MRAFPSRATHSREQGHDTAEELETYLKDLGSYEYYLQERRLEQAAAGNLEEADDEQGDASGTDGEAATADEDLASAIGIEEVVGFRIFLGNEQWHVRWAPHRCDDGVEETSWERFAILDTPALRSTANRLRSAAAQSEDLRP